MERLPLTYNWSEKSILIVEDSHSCYKYFSEALKRTGVRLMRAETGPGALELCCLRREYFDLVMVDVQIPFISGIEVIREVRRSRPTLPILAVTAFSSNDIRRRCYIAGCHEYLVKPVPPKQLLSVFRSYLEPTATEQKVTTL